MNAVINTLQKKCRSLLVLLSFFVVQQVSAGIPGVTGNTFNLSAKDGYISTGDGDSIYMWGFADNGGHNAGQMQYPGPTLIVTEGDTVTINLTNTLGVPVSMVFPGQTNVTASGGDQGLMTREAASAGGTVTYTFVAQKPGTYLYHSGTNPPLQVEMGLQGALIVRPASYNASSNRIAYNDAASTYDREHLFFLSSIDDEVHNAVEAGNFDAINNTDYSAVLWFINGRNMPDTVLGDFYPLLPNQPYSSLARMHPGDNMLMRFASASRDAHPFHAHGNNSIVIARDGRFLQSPGGTGADLSTSEYTIPVIAGATYDALFTWTGANLGFDIYGPVAGIPEQGIAAHTCNAADDTVDNKTGAAGSDGFHDSTWEYCDDHGKPVPVLLPELQDMTFGGFYSGSPFLGAFGSLPVGEGGLNLNGGMTFPWHSHTERELTNNDVFPGGMFTIVIIEPHSVSIP
jgi:hypothetical protein